MAEHCPYFCSWRVTNMKRLFVCFLTPLLSLGICFPTMTTAKDYLLDPAVEMDIFLSGAHYDGVSDTMLGGGAGMIGHFGPVYLRGLAEGLDQSGGISEAVRGQLGLGLVGQWDKHQKVIVEFGSRYLDNSWLGADWEGNRKDISLELGMKGETHYFHTDLRAVMLYPTDDNANVQAGLRLEVLSLNEDGRYAFKISGEVLSNEQTIRIGLRRRL